MLFNVKRDDLFQAVSSVQRATAARVIQPILSNILIEAISPNQLKLSATDLDFSIETVILAECSQLGKITISAKKLAEILSKLPKSQEVSCSVDSVAQTVRIESGSVIFDIRTLPADEFPSIPVFDESNYIDVNAAAFLKAVAQTAFAAAGYDSNNVLAGVFFQFNGQGLEMAATDGSRLAKRIDAISSDLPALDHEVSAIIPAKILQELTKLLSSDLAQDDVIRIGVNEGQIAFRAERYYVVSRLLDGMYPKYNQLIPQNNRIVIFTRRKEFIDALERTSVMANERTNIVKLSFSNNSMSLEAQTPDVGDSQDSMVVEYSGEPFHIAFNYRYVIDALKVIDSDDVRMETSGALAPTLFKSRDDNNYLCLVMPVQVK